MFLKVNFYIYLRAVDQIIDLTDYYKGYMFTENTIHILTNNLGNSTIITVISTIYDN